ncbi:hypothetical protein ADK57_40625 [Streptomyces sp. MMG1533]|nr:hypothetical protein ADK57_40625 [Streptomyces sp. MMG1533]
MFADADQAPVQYQGPVGLLDPPPLRLRGESLVLRVAFNGLDVDAQAGGVGGDLVLEALVDQRVADGAAGVVGDRVQRAMPAVLSCVLAARTVTAMTGPSTSTAGAPLRPGTRFAGSRPVVEAGPPAVATRSGGAALPCLALPCLALPCLQRDGTRTDVVPIDVRYFDMMKSRA